jgi:hypothetical protein
MKMNLFSALFPALFLFGCGKDLSPDSVKQAVQSPLGEFVGIWQAQDVSLAPSQGSCVVSIWFVTNNEIPLANNDNPDKKPENKLVREFVIAASPNTMDSPVGVEIRGGVDGAKETKTTLITTVDGFVNSTEVDNTETNFYHKFDTKLSAKGTKTKFRIEILLPETDQPEFTKVSLNTIELSLPQDRCDHTRRSN